MLVNQLINLKRCYVISSGQGGGMTHVYLHVAPPMPRGLESQEIIHGTDPLSVTNQCRMSNIYWAECFGPCGAAHVLQAMDRDFAARAMHSLGAAWRLVRLRLHIVFFSNSYCFQNFTFILPYFIFHFIYFSLFIPFILFSRTFSFLSTCFAMFVHASFH